MARGKVVPTIDDDVKAVEEILHAYKKSHPRARTKSYRQNSGSIRLRIIDPGFAEMDRAVRHDQIWGLLRQLDKDVISQITVVLLLTPEEAKTSFASMDFDSPVPSDL
jgi:hypothetical protein